MALIIDGYNLLHASGILAHGVGPSTLERARGALLNFLAESLEPETLRRTTVVFDARAAPPGAPRVVQHRGLRVHFAPNPGDADELIEQLIQADTSPRRLVVVSSDHRLQRAARRRGARPVDSQVWYAETLRTRIERQRHPESEPPKPTGQLSEFEVGFWLRKFGLSPETAAASEPPESQLPDLQSPGPQSPDGQSSASPPAAGPTDKPRPGGPRVGHRRAGGPRAGDNPRAGDRPIDGRFNPFPPGYGEDLLDEEEP